MDTKEDIGKPESMKSFRRLFFILTVTLLAVICLNCQEEKGDFQQTGTVDDKILDRIGVSRGICVVLSDQNCKFSLDLVQKSELVIYVPLSKDDQVLAARRAADAAGFYGTRIYVEKSDPQTINLADNIADVLIALSDTLHITENEVLRILRPEGKALFKNKDLVKPFPEGVDDWSHPYHGPDNNTQSKDKVVLAPYLTQFLAEPYYGPVTQVAVASAGRVFKGFGNVAFHEREEPFLNTLVAFNGYNGTMLWKRDLVPGIMLHRNTMIATPTTLFVGDDKSCKLIDTETGQLKGEIKPPLEVAGGTFWKWMGMEDDVLYALIGDQEQKDPVMRWRRQKHGWPWTDISKGFNQSEHSWGFGKNMLAMNPITGKVLWHYQEDEAIDSRGTGLKNGRIYLFRFGSFLTCLNAKSGKIIWRKTRENAPELFEAFGEYLPRQSWETNWRTRNYILCSDDALYFAGPQIDKLLAVSTEDGSVLWKNSYNNFQIVLRDDGLFGISGPWRNNVSKKFDPLTGEILADLPTGRRACTRPSATADAIFFRANGGTVRFDLASYMPQWISPMRPPCFDGVTIANGQLYFWPFVCDCQLSIYGFNCLGPAGDFGFNIKAKEEERLEKGTADLSMINNMIETPADWPSFRKDNQCRVTSNALISKKGYELWRFPEYDGYIVTTNVFGHEHYTVLTAPVTVDGLVFYGSSDGVVRAVDVISGQLVWQAYTGGAVRLAPTVWNGRLLIGSGDGYVYCLEARTGDMIWRFRAAPIDRKIPVYGSLISTWPVASGVRVQDGIAYAAAGIVNYDGTHVYALDAATGKIKWQNNTSGHLYPEARTGASVMGHLLLKKDRLYMASGTSLSPAVYDVTDGRCLNDPELLKNCESLSPRGWELYLVGDHVVASGKPFYSHPKHTVYDETVKNKLLHTSVGKRDIVWVNQKKVLCYPPIDKNVLNNSVRGQSFTGYLAPIWANLDIPSEPYWEYNCEGSVALAACKNAVVIAEKTDIVVLDLSNGRVLWSQPLEYSPVPWGLAISRDGKIIVTLEDGSVRCFGGNSTVPTPYVSSNNTYFVGTTKVVLACDTKGARIRYTVDGTEPTLQSKLYTRPFPLNNPITLKMRAFANNQATSFVVTENFKKVEYARVIDPGNIEVGLQCDYFEGSYRSVADLDKAKPVKSGLMTQFEMKPRNGVNEFGYIYHGYILIPEDDIYIFYLASNDGSKLFLNEEELIDNDGGHGTIEKSGKIALKAGEYPIKVKYFQMGGSKDLKVSWESTTLKKQEITARVLFHKTKE